MSVTDTTSALGRLAGTNASTIRVVVVDDSALMRRHIKDMIESEAGLSVVGIAGTGEDAVARVAELKPHVVTLDVDMPGETGVETIPKILSVYPVPIIMFSSRTQRGARVTLDALSNGAVDFLAKPDSRIPGDVKKVRDELVAKIRACATAKVALPREARKSVSQLARVVGKPTGNGLDRQLIAIGISTGGPPALQEVFTNLEPPFPPIAVVQHMPPNFTKAFADRLNELCPFEVKEAENGDALVPNRVLIAAGGCHLRLKKTPGQVIAELWDGEQVSGHKPSVDVLFSSASEIFGANLLGVIMTGMGRDGADGCRKIRSRGGATLGQDQATSTVYGMNKVAFQEGGVEKQFALSDLPNLIRKHADKCVG